MKLFQLAAVPLLLCTLSAFAAKPVDLAHQPANYIATLNQLSLSPTVHTAIKEMSQQIDAKKTKHIRINQTYAGYPVWNGEGVMHQPLNKKATMNGKIYDDLDADLQPVPNAIFKPEQAQKAIANALTLLNESQAQTQQADLVVYVDANNTAHWAFHISLVIEKNERIIQPNFLVDAASFDVYQQWDNVKTLDDVKGGGFGGNPKLGKLVYDGSKNNLALLNIQREPETATCFLKNDMLSVSNFQTKKLASFTCYQPDKRHNNVYFDKAMADGINEGYSPNNDSYFAGEMLQRMYKELFNVDVLSKNGKPMPLRIMTHKKMENAEWQEGLDIMIIGDGEEMFYPLASIGVIAHEVSHGFTAQHSNLAYYGQSGGLNEAFSDMATQVVDLYAYGKNNWQVGYEIVKAKGAALRYLDMPSKDCYEGAERCSIDDVSGYHPNMNVHNSSGVYNRAYYLLATSSGWDVNKAFQVMLQANRYYWTKTESFDTAACGVIQAAEDFEYPTKAIYKAFKKVGVDTSQC